MDRVFHALGDATRRAMVDHLRHGRVPASHLAALLAVTVTAVIQHLRVLEDSRLVRTAKVGRVRTCELDPAGLAALENWAAERRTAWERRLDRLGQLLDE